MATKKGKQGRGPALCVQAMCLQRTKTGARLCDVHKEQRRESKGCTHAAPAVVSRAARRKTPSGTIADVSATCVGAATSRSTSSPSTATTTTVATPNLLVCNVNEAARERRAPS
jgi:hypothetical protein